MNSEKVPIYDQSESLAFDNQSSNKNEIRVFVVSGEIAY